MWNSNFFSVQHFLKSVFILQTHKIQKKIADSQKKKRLLHAKNLVPLSAARYEKSSRSGPRPDNNHIGPRFNKMAPLDDNRT